MILKYFCFFSFKNCLGNSINSLYTFLIRFASKLMIWVKPSYLFTLYGHLRIWNGWKKQTLLFWSKFHSHKPPMGTQHYPQWMKVGEECFLKGKWRCSYQKEKINVGKAKTTNGQCLWYIRWWELPERVLKTDSCALPVLPES